jgi:hypothetical protein
LIREGEAWGEGEPIPGAWINGVLVQTGTLVRLNPAAGSSPDRLALRGKSASVDRIEVDFEGRVTLAVVLDPDPAAEAGASGEPGRRLTCRAEEVVPLPASEGEVP